MLMSTEPLLLFNSSVHGCQMSVSGPANLSEALWDSLVVSQGVLRQLHSSRKPAIIYNGEKKRMIRLLLNYENCRFDRRWLYRCRAVAPSSCKPLNFCTCQVPGRELSGWILRRTVWMYGHIKKRYKQGVSSNEKWVNMCKALRYLKSQIGFLKIRMTLFSNFFFQLRDIMFCWIQCLECLSITCGVIRLLFGGVGWQGKWSLSAWYFLFFFCTTCNLWLTSASFALLLTALLHCFKHIKQCCWSFSLLVTNPHYLFPCIYVLFCFVFPSSAFFHDLLLFKRTAFLHACMFWDGGRAKMCLGVEESFLKCLQWTSRQFQRTMCFPALLKWLDVEQYWSDVDTLSFYTFVFSS